MSGDVIKICASALIAAVCGILLRELGWRGAGIFSVFALVIFLGTLADGIASLSKDVFKISEEYGLGQTAKEILKVIGASYLFGICSDLCSDLGEQAIAKALTAVGRVEILLIVTPYFFKMIRSAADLLGQ